MRLYEAVIGLEVHAQLMTESKVFCRAKHETSDEPNSNVGIVSAGLPGSLPVMNEKAVELAVRAGLALGCKIALQSQFARKNYFYPDLPKGYQISQMSEPICEGGSLEILSESGKKRVIALERIHIEEDAGKSIHSSQGTFVNLNRAGVPLIEIVSKPELKTPAEASAYLRKLHAILLFAEVCDGNLEKGNFRCDANISIRLVGEKKLGTRAELKNINSFKFIEKALEYEIARQIAVVEGGGRIVQETRGWDSAVSKTYSMRSKEEAQDYRYFPDPDLPPLVITSHWIENIKRILPELPEQKIARYVSNYQLSHLDAEVLTSELGYVEYFESCVQLGANPKTSANWICSEVLRKLKEDPSIQLSDAVFRPESLVELLLLIEKNVISGKIAKTVFEDLWSTGASPEKYVQEKGLIQVLDETQIDAWVNEVLEAFPSQVAEFQAGNEKILGFFMGEVMKRSKGKANPPMLNQKFRKVLLKGDSN